MLLYGREVPTRLLDGKECTYQVYHRVEMLLAELEQVQQLLLSFICVYRCCCHQVVKPGPTSGPTVGNSLTNHASSSTAARTNGINCGQDSSSFSCNHRRDPPGIIQGGGKDPSVGICGISKFVNNTGYEIRRILLRC